MNKQILLDVVQEVGWCLDIGKARNMNEDFVAVEKVNRPHPFDQHPAGIYVLADGMGGHKQGDVASRLAAHTAVAKMLHECVRAPDKLQERGEEWLIAAFQLAHAVVNARNRERNTNMGTTLVAAVVAGRQAHIASVGDSRAYLVSPTDIQQLTHDHSYVQELLDNGLISPDQVRKHPYRGVLTQAIGLGCELELDLLLVELKLDDYLLLCSDGLTKELDDKTIGHMVRQAVSTQQACETLIAAANAAGGHDNIAVVLVRLREERAISS